MHETTTMFPKYITYVEFNSEVVAQEVSVFVLACCSLTENYKFKRTYPTLK